MTSRKQLSTRTRFEVFKRDGFVCFYCGRHPPDVTLEVDHFDPVAEGGTNDPDNLVTSCFDCNRGKAAVPLSSVPPSLNDKAVLIAEREAQLRGYYEIMDQQRQRVQDEVWEVMHIFDERAKTFRRDWLLSIQRFIERLDRYAVIDAMTMARAKVPFHDNGRFRYFCKVCWNKITEREGPPANG
jgi:hypothetical protein